MSLPFRIRDCELNRIKVNTYIMVFVINSIPNDKILDWSNLKAVAYGISD